MPLKKKFETSPEVSG